LGLLSIILKPLLWANIWVYKCSFLKLICTQFWTSKKYRKIARILKEPLLLLLRG